MSRLPILILLVSLPGVALAQPAMGRSYAARGMTMQERTFRMDLGPYERGINDSGTILGPFGSAYGLRIQGRSGAGDDDTWVGFGAGLAYGITDELEVGALLLPINTYNEDFGHVTPYLRWAFVSTSGFQLGLQGTVAIPTGNNENLGLGVGMPMNIRVADRVRIETGAELEIYFDTGNDDGTDDDAYLNLDIPLAIGIDVGRKGFVGPRASFVWYNFDYLVVPLGAFGGFTFTGRNGNGGDLTASFSFFLADDEIFLPNWELVFGANFYFGL